MKSITRRYVYQEDYNTIIEWAEQNNITNEKNRFTLAHSLYEYLKLKVK
jgi:hypothetical protein